MISKVLMKTHLVVELLVGARDSSTIAHKHGGRLGPVQTWSSFAHDPIGTNTMSERECNLFGLVAFVLVLVLVLEKWEWKVELVSGANKWKSLTLLLLLVHILLNANLIQKSKTVFQFFGPYFIYCAFAI